MLLRQNESYIKSRKRYDCYLTKAPEQKYIDTMQTEFASNTHLLQRYKNGDKSAGEELVKNNLALVKNIARRYSSNTAEPEDLIEVGNIGLIKAIEGFDESLGFCFSTYAFSLINGEIKRFLRDDGIIKVSRKIKYNAKIVRKAREDYFKTYGREPKISELCKNLGLSQEDIICAIESTNNVVSLEEKINRESENLTLCDILEIEDNTLSFIENYSLMQAVEKLDKDEKRLIELRYFRNLTQSTCAKLLNTTQVSISRSEKKIINKLRTVFLSIM